MNFLGHCLLSDEHPSALVGSLWPDFARKPDDDDCSAMFIVHFEKHQRIDRFTDRHETLEPLREALRPVFRKTTPLLVDMLLDHFLANHWHDYHHQPLASFAQSTYQRLSEFDEIPMPEPLVKTIFWMKHHNWFVSYQAEAAIKRALSGIAKRIRFTNPIEDNLDKAFAIYYHQKYAIEPFMRALLEEFKA